MKTRRLALLTGLVIGGIALGFGLLHWPPARPLLWLGFAQQRQESPTTIIDYTPQEPAVTGTGLCWARSELLNLANAWRCGADTGTIYDPCFSITLHDDSHVICGADPATDNPGVLLTLREPFFLPPIDQQSPQVWQLTLADGDHCTLLAEATLTFANQSLRYQCGDSSFILDDLRPGTVWFAQKVQIAATEDGYQLLSQKEVAVRTLWRAALPTALIQLTEIALQNAVYQIDGQQLRLNGGSFDDKLNARGSSRPIYSLTNWHVGADLNHDGSEDQVVVLNQATGGSGDLLYLAIVLNYAGEPFNVATLLLGDRSSIEDLTIEQGQILVTLLTQGPGDAMCCASQRVRLTYQLQGSSLRTLQTEVLSPSYLTRIANATYRLANTNETIPLVDGHYAQAGLQVALMHEEGADFPMWSSGDLLGSADSVEAVTVLAIKRGNLVKHQLVVLALEESRARPLAQLLLDDAIQVSIVYIEDHQIVLTPVTAATATDPQPLYYVIVNNKLVLQSNELQ